MNKPNLLFPRKKSSPYALGRSSLTSQRYWVYQRERGILYRGRLPDGMAYDNRKKDTNLSVYNLRRTRDYQVRELLFL